MKNNIVFIGGIHGVGKSTICQVICHELGLEYLSASELLKWEAINEDSKNKKVTDITETQSKLIESLQNTVLKDKLYLLDGHYCLLNRDNVVSEIPLKTFLQIKPIILNIILGDINEIQKRLEDRDKKPYKYKLLEHFQNSELKYATYLSQHLKIPINIGRTNDYSNIIKSISKIL